MAPRDPQLLSQALAELISLRGFARSRADSDLHDTWRKVAGDSWSESTKPVKISRGVLYVDVRSSALLGELAAFHGPELTQQFQQLAPHLRVKSIKFRLAGK
ncbi:MAG: hypothetical protein B7Z55_09615 [Planctomycetales bacterium 12-60-4]|nr:MAG: hypothetical protein B7Z55_09615 [Planctomycetales bacterium 12-60-4]